jgi:hypothetical protein
MLNHLALIIDLREERLEKTSVPFLRRQIAAELEVLSARFQREYEAFLLSNGANAAVQPIKAAA